MRAAMVDCIAGVSGDMWLGAWLDTGVDEVAWRRLLGQLGLTDVQVTLRRVLQRGIRALKVDVQVAGQPADTAAATAAVSGRRPRGWRELAELISRCDLPAPVRELSLQAFRLLVEAEGRVHGILPEQVHLHEAGADDALIDVVGAVAGWYLAGMPACFASPVEVGGGVVHCAHGGLPVPAPATVELLQGFVTYSSGTWGETATPTGAAILRVLCRPDPAPPLRVLAVGYGAGSRSLPVANVLRIRLGEVAAGTAAGGAAAGWTEAFGTAEAGAAVLAGADPLAAGEAEGWPPARQEEVYQLAANVDDMPAEWAAYALDRLLAEGALDAWITPAVMKKGRPGWVVQALCRPGDRDRLTALLQRETTTLGVRGLALTRTALARRWKVVATPYGPVRVKLAGVDGQVWNAAPEFADCKACAEHCGVPLKEVYQA
ncbi:MAG: nickel pincer cofactor biosynthesis protein LarC, partial [Alicyclobacillus sp.]|nr:nickel pincer cofactor biosynthesis protein LarC [Alicyclobacillus sp.]